MKTVYLLIAALIIALVAWAAGLHSGRASAHQACIDEVSENCEYICGVGADFYYPNEQIPDRSADPEQQRERMIAYEN